MEIKVCDYCSKHMNAGEELPVCISFFYGSIFDGEVKEFCCDSCALIWYIKEYKRFRNKQKKPESKPKIKKSIPELAWNK